MSITDLISKCSPVKDTTVLGTIWTKNKDLCCASMLKHDVQMLTDMVECQDLIAALDIASKNNIPIPKLSAKFVKNAKDYDSVFVDIKSKVPEAFALLLWSIQDGTDNHGLSYRVKESEYITSIRQTKQMDTYILSPGDNLKVINSTL